MAYIPFFKENNLGIINAAGHALGLLTKQGPREWHPTSAEVKAACKKAADICNDNGIEFGKLAMYHFLQSKDTTTCLVGMATRELLDINLDAYYNGLTEKEERILNLILTTYVLIIESYLLLILCFVLVFLRRNQTGKVWN